MYYYTRCVKTTRLIIDVLFSAQFIQKWPSFKGFFRQQIFKEL